MDVVDLREFYQTALGHSAQGLVSRVVRPRLMVAPGQTVLGLGYAHPYLEHINQEDAVVLSFMLARQGVIHWPSDQAVRSALVDEYELPLLESVVDHAVVAHGLELAQNPLDMLQEIWRVMAPQGKLYLIVPNRRGLWAASEKTPFGFGQPFSRFQLASLLKEAKFSPLWWTEALALPPFKAPALIKSAAAVEFAGARIWGRFSGVIVVEAMKQVYAFSSGKRSRRLVPRLRPVLLPSPRPASALVERGS
jgi:SAM-dependent methyltransferase